MFKEREDPEDVYVMIRNRMKNNLLGEFYLEDAIKLAKRLYDALPDTVSTVKRYVEVIRLELQTHVNDELYTRKRGLYKFSMILNRTHQHEFESSKHTEMTSYAILCVFVKTYSINSQPNSILNSMFSDAT